MSRRPFTLYWSSLATYEDCPQKFLWGRGWGNIDLGNGPGRRKTVPVKKSEHHAVMGVAIQYAIERFYNDELWKTMDHASLKNRLVELADEMFRIELTKRYVDWRVIDGGRSEIEKLVRDAVMGYMVTMKHHRLLGPYARAEVEMLGYANSATPVGGRADVMIRRDDTGTTILDGKNSKRYKDQKTKKYTVTYTDPDQLRWYALLFYLIHKKRVDRLGFVYYRYPYGMPIDGETSMDTGEIEDGVDWVEYTMDDLNGLASRAIDATASIDAGNFEPRPTPKTCGFCDYESVCPQRIAQKESNRRSPRVITGIDLIPGGVSTFSMD